MSHLFLFPRFLRALPALALASASFVSPNIIAQSASSLSSEAHDGGQLDDYLVETARAAFDRKAPAVTQQWLAADLRNVTLTTTAGALKNFPNLFIRERFLGDKNAPIGIRGTSNRQTGRTVVLADGLLLSNFLGTGFGNSPRWFLVAPEEIEKVAVIYGPFTALHAGNSIGGTVLITTKMPTGPQTTVQAQSLYHRFTEYGTVGDHWGHSAFASTGDAIGRFSYYVFYQRFHNESAPTQFATINVSATSPGALPDATAVTGAFPDTDFARQRRIVYGSEGPTETTHDLLKLKLVYQFGHDTALRYTAAVWRNEERRDAPESYLRDATGRPVFSGRVSLFDRTFTIPASQFGLMERTQSDLVQGLTVSHQPGDGLQWLVNTSHYAAGKDRSRASSVPPGQARVGGAGQGTEIDDTGWTALDLVLGYKASEGYLAFHRLTAGVHASVYHTESDQRSLSDWRTWSSRRDLLNGSGGRTRTRALYLQDGWSLSDRWTLTSGVRWEMWRADDGFRERDFSGERVRSAYPDRSANALSPKLALDWKPAPSWSARLTLAKADRFPTVGELFQGSISANGSITNNDPDLRPERALAADLTVEKAFSVGSARISLFEEAVDHALLNQTTLRPDGTSFSGTQNIGRIQTRGFEAMLDVKPSHPGARLGGYLALSYTDATIVSNPGLRASEGKQVPRIPLWQSRLGLTWNPVDRLTLSGQLRTGGRQFNTLDNSDPAGGYGGVDEYAVVDLKLTASLRPNVTASLGVDNVGDDRYYVFHPMPERTFVIEVTWRR